MTATSQTSIATSYSWVIMSWSDQSSREGASCSSLARWWVANSRVSCNADVRAFERMIRGWESLRRY
jgi:hypothetical protein